jgi:hypothetical protein
VRKLVVRRVWRGSPAKYRAIWRIGTVSIGAAALGVVGIGPGAAATGCGDCAGDPAVGNPALCAAPGTIGVDVSGVPSGETGSAIGGVRSGAERLVDGSDVIQKAVDCGIIQVKIGDSPGGSESPSESPRGRHSSGPSEKVIEGSDGSSSIWGDLRRSGSPGIPSPRISRGMRLPIPSPAPSTPSGPRLPMVATAPRAARPAASASPTGRDDTSSVITVAIGAASAGLVCGGLLGAGVRRRRSTTP